MALLAAADELLGPVLRDATVLRAVATHPGGTPALQRATIVALALMGCAPDGVADDHRAISDLVELRAWLLARILAGGRIADVHAHAPALALAVRRLQHGRLLSAVG